LGQVIAERTESNISDNSFDFDLSGLGKGIYFIALNSSDQERVVRKIVIE
jgi:hypothetical protein